MSPPHHTNLWSLEEEARLLELAATASRIVDVADAMSKSRNAIVGKLARMRRNGQVGVIEWSLRPNRYQARKQSPSPRMMPPTPKPPPPDPVRAEPDVETFSMRRLSLMELGHRTCRWLIGDVGAPEFCFCGNPTDGDRVYCAVHHVVAHGR